VQGGAGRDRAPVDHAGPTHLRDSPDQARFWPARTHQALADLAKQLRGQKLAPFVRGAATTHRRGCLGPQLMRPAGPTEPPRPAALPACPVSPCDEGPAVLLRDPPAPPVRERRPAKVWPAGQLSLRCRADGEEPSWTRLAGSEGSARREERGRLEISNSRGPRAENDFPARRAARAPTVTQPASQPPC
jgi:hypothetical protein